MPLSKRLEQIAAMVPYCSCITDIGCDHGYLPVALVERGIVKHAIAMDINEGPLESCKRSVCESKLESYIEIRLSNGFEALRAGEAETAIIAGMGGIVIDQILRNAAPEVLGSLKALILQPQTDWALVRKTAHELGFRIEEEAFILDRGKYYVVMRLVPGEESYASDYEYRYGRILFTRRSEEFENYIKAQADRLKTWADKAKDPEVSAMNLAEAAYLYQQYEAMQGSEPEEGNE